MKFNFLKQISKMLAFSIFVMGLPVDLKAGDQTPYACPTGFSWAFAKGSPPNGCGTAFNPTNCAINSCFQAASKNSPQSIDPSIMASMPADTQASTVANSATNQIMNTTTYLGQALLNYNQLTTQYSTLAMAYNELGSLFNNYLVVQGCPAANTYGGGCPLKTTGGTTLGTLPFTTGNINSPSTIYAGGDFVPLNLSQQESGELMFGYLQSLYNTQSTAASKQAVLYYLTSALLSSFLSKQMPSFNYYFYAWTVFANQVQVQDPLSGAWSVSPLVRTPTQMLSFINNSNYAKEFVFDNGTIPTNFLTLLASIAQASWDTSGSNPIPVASRTPGLTWTAQQTNDLYTLVSSISAMNMDLIDSTFTGFTFADSEGGQSNYGSIAYFLRVMQSMLPNGDALGGKLYFNCSRSFSNITDINGNVIDAGSLIYDDSIYYAASPSSSAITVQQQYASDQKIYGATTIQTLDTSSLPSTISNAFTYLKGSFYLNLSSIPSCSSTTSCGFTNANSALGYSGLNSSGPGSFWQSVCATSPSAVIAGTGGLRTQIANIIAPLVSTDTSVVPNNSNGPGAPTFAGKTLQGAQSNLLVAAQAALTWPPFTLKSSISSGTATLVPNPVYSSTAMSMAASYLAAYSSWVNASYPVVTDTAGSIATAQAAASQAYTANPASTLSVPSTFNADNGAVVYKTYLSGFDASCPASIATAGSCTASQYVGFYNVDHGSMLGDLFSILQAYGSCWGNYSGCKNNFTPPTKPGEIQQILNGLKNMITPAGIVSMVVGLVVISGFMHYASKAYNAVKAPKTAGDAKAASTEPASTTDITPPTPDAGIPGGLPGPGGLTPINTGGGGQVSSQTYEQMNEQLQTQKNELSEMISEGNVTDLNAMRTNLLNMRQQAINDDSLSEKNAIEEEIESFNQSTEGVDGVEPIDV